MIEVEAPIYIRGRSLAGQVIVIDEAQSLDGASREGFGMNGCSEQVPVPLIRAAGCHRSNLPVRPDPPPTAEETLVREA